MRSVTRILNVVSSVICVKQGPAFFIKIVKGKNHETIAAAYDEFHARSIMRGIREMYGLDRNALEPGDHFLTAVNKEVKKLKQLKQKGYVSPPDNWNAFAAQLFQQLPGVQTASRKPRKKVLAALDQEIASQNGALIRRKK